MHSTLFWIRSGEESLVNIMKRPPDGCEGRFLLPRGTGSYNNADKLSIIISNDNLVRVDRVISYFVSADSMSQ
jgi:hypothetical protein